MLDTVRGLVELGFTVKATGGTARYLEQNGVAAQRVNKVSEGRPHVVDAIVNGQVQLVFNTTEGAQALHDSRSLRRAALLHKVPYYTTLAGAMAASEGIRAYAAGDLEVRGPAGLFRIGGTCAHGPRSRRPRPRLLHKRAAYTTLASAVAATPRHPFKAAAGRVFRETLGPLAVCRRRTVLFSLTASSRPARGPVLEVRKTWHSSTRFR